MQFSEKLSEESSPAFTWQDIIDWAKIHYRDRIFRKDEQIPARPQLIYLVNQGVVRLVSQNQNTPEPELLVKSEEFDHSEESFLGFVGAQRPFEIVTQSSCSINAYAHVDQTHVAWLYWKDLKSWPDFQ